MAQKKLTTFFFFSSNLFFFYVCCLPPRQFPMSRTYTKKKKIVHLENSFRSWSKMRGDGRIPPPPSHTKFPQFSTSKKSSSFEGPSASNRRMTADVWLSPPPSPNKREKKNAGTGIAIVGGRLMYYMFPSKVCNIFGECLSPPCRPDGD